MRQDWPGPARTGTWVRTGIAAGAFLFLFAMSLGAQERPNGDVPAAIGPQWQVSTNPFAVLLEWFGGEAEWGAGETVGVGLSLTRFSDPEDSSDDGVRGLNVIGRYYPGGEVLRGFYFGGRLGWYWIDETVYNSSGTQRTETTTSPGFGVEVGYNWVFGEDGGFYLGLGGGLTRLFDADNTDFDFIPVFRIVNVGWAF